VAATSLSLFLFNRKRKRKDLSDLSYRADLLKIVCGGTTGEEEKEEQVQRVREQEIQLVVS
jgi:hypothetical protein